MDTFARRFREQRLKAGLSQNAIAEVCRNLKGEGLSRAAVAQWEARDASKRTRPDFDNLISAAKKMGASIDYLVGLTDDPAPVKPGLSPEAYELAREWDRLPFTAKDTVVNCLKWSKRMESQKERNSMLLLKQMLLNQIK